MVTLFEVDEAKDSMLTGRVFLEGVVLMIDLFGVAEAPVNSERLVFQGVNDTCFQTLTVTENTCPPICDSCL